MKWFNLFFFSCSAIQQLQLHSLNAKSMNNKLKEKHTHIPKRNKKKTLEKGTRCILVHIPHQHYKFYGFKCPFNMILKFSGETIAYNWILCISMENQSVRLSLNDVYLATHRTLGCAFQKPMTMNAKRKYRTMVLVNGKHCSA